MVLFVDRDRVVRLDDSEADRSALLEQEKLMLELVLLVLVLVLVAPLRLV